MNKLFRKIFLLFAFLLLFLFLPFLSGNIAVFAQKSQETPKVSNKGDKNAKDSKDSKDSKGDKVDKKDTPPATKTSPPPTPTTNPVAGKNYVSFKTDTIIKLKASPKIEVTSITEYMSRGQNPGLKVLMSRADIKQVKSNWSKYLKVFKGKSKGKEEELFTDNATIVKMSDNVVDIYSRIEQTADGVSLKAFFDLGGAFLSKENHADKFAVGQGILHDFAANQVLKALQPKLLEEEDKLLRLAQDRKNLDIKGQELELEIAKLKEAILRAEQDVKTIQETKVKKNVDVQQQVQTVEQLKQDIKTITGE